MLVLTVISYNGGATEALYASFDECGGAIGRAENSHMVLPDAERTVSRKHAQIGFRNGKYLIVDHGSNPISVNGRELGKGQEQAIAPGDTVQLGGYLLSVTAGQAGTAPSSDDPFAGLFDQTPPARTSSPAPAYPAPPAPSPSAEQRNSLIPDDWDPFANVPAASHADPSRPVEPLHAPNARAEASSIAAQLVQSSEDSLENLFGLRNAPVRDPFAASPLGRQPAEPNTAGDADPMRALHSPQKASKAPIPDDFPELKTPWEERISAPTIAPAGALREPASIAQDPPPGAVLSWEQAASPSAVSYAPLPDARVRPAPAQTAPAAAQAATPTPDAQAQTGDIDALLAALLEGLDVPTLRIDALTPSLMFRCGALLRAATGGTVDLLAARAALKREVRADVTMIITRENNPLKFSPTVETALHHLLGPSEKGFTPPIAAVRDAFDDLRAHQIGVMAGMRSALEGVLARFDPAQLEAQLVPRTGLAGLLPANRQARLWAAFEALHTQLASEAEDAFHDLFGSAFRQAYEAHIDQLKQTAKPE